MTSRASLVVALVLVGAVAVMAGTLGGLDKERPADDHVRKIVSSANDALKREFGDELVKIEPVSYKTQLVAGMNYFVRAIATLANGTKKHVHVRIYKPLHGPTELSAVKLDVDESSPLSWFSK